MLQLTVVAPNKQKVEAEFNPTANFGDVKAKVEEVLGVPFEKQRLLCNGKERKDNKETLTAAKVGAKCKLMLMLVPGYTMPDAPVVARIAEKVPEVPLVAEAAAVDVEADLPRAAAVSVAETSGLVHVRQARNRYHVRVAQGLAAATFGELADFLAPTFFAGVPSSELRFLSRGKTAERKELLGKEGAREVSVMLLFKENFHLAEEGGLWLKDSLLDLADVEEHIVRLRKRIEANFSSEETALQLAELRGTVETMEQSVESVPVRGTVLDDMRQFQARLLVAKAHLDELRKNLKL